MSTKATIYTDEFRKIYENNSGPLPWPICFNFDNGEKEIYFEIPLENCRKMIENFGNDAQDFIKLRLQ